MIEIKDGFFKEVLIIDDFMPEDTLLMAPKEFTALLVEYFEAVRAHNEVAIDNVKLLIEVWLAKEINVKRICVIKNIGK